MEDAQVQKEWGRLAQLISATISVSDLLSVHIHLGLFSVIIELSTLLFVFFFVALGFSLLPFFFFSSVFQIFATVSRCCPSYLSLLSCSGRGNISNVFLQSRVA